MDAYTLPHIIDTMHIHLGAKYFKFRLKQWLLANGDERWTKRRLPLQSTIKAPTNIQRLAFGLTNAPATFQCLIESQFEGVPDIFRYFNLLGVF